MQILIEKYFDRKIKYKIRKRTFRMNIQYKIYLYKEHFL